MNIVNVSALITLVVFMLIGIYVGKRGGRTASDYTVASRSSSSYKVAGIIMGALVGGASTVGTVQMAYAIGFSAWWFTLGAGIACLVLGLFFSKKLRSTRLTTIPEFLKQHYGSGVAVSATLFSSIGTFISVMAQFLSASAILKSVLHVGSGWTMFLTVLLILSFIFLGGLKGYSLMGVFKIMFLYSILVICAMLIFFKGYTPAMIYNSLPKFPFFSLFGRGLWKDLSAGLSLVVGVLSTQIYIQAVFSASDEESAVKGALLSAFLIPPLGLLGIYVGLYLRTAIGPGLDTSQALPYFILNHFPPVIAGIFVAGILITIIGTGAGLILGITTNIVRDLLPHSPFKAFVEGLKTDKAQLRLNRIILIILLALGGFLSYVFSRKLILTFSYLAMGLRGAGICIPFVLALTVPNFVTKRAGFYGTIVGPIVTALWPLTGIKFQPLFAGLISCALVVFMFTFLERKVLEN